MQFHAGLNSNLIVDNIHLIYVYITWFNFMTINYPVPELLQCPLLPLSECGFLICVFTNSHLHQPEASFWLERKLSQQSLLQLLVSTCDILFCFPWYLGIAHSVARALVLGRIGVSHEISLLSSLFAASNYLAVILLLCPQKISCQ